MVIVVSVESVYLAKYEAQISGQQTFHGRLHVDLDAFPSARLQVPHEFVCHVLHRLQHSLQPARGEGRAELLAQVPPDPQVARYDQPHDPVGEPDLFRREVVVIVCIDDTVTTVSTVISSPLH